MRSTPVLLCVGVVLLAAAWREPQTPVTKTVNITFKCSPTDGATIIVVPWRVELPTRSDEVKWDVSTGSDSVFIEAKAVNRWPFSSNPPYKAKPGSPAVGKGIPSSVAAGKYQYNIRGTCKRASGVVDEVLVDPDMIIPGIIQGPGT